MDPNHHRYQAIVDRLGVDIVREKLREGSLVQVNGHFARAWLAAKDLETAKALERRNEARADESLDAVKRSAMAAERSAIAAETSAKEATYSKAVAIVATIVSVLAIIAGISIAMNE